MSRFYKLQTQWDSYTFDNSADCVGTILKIAYDSAISEEESREQAQDDNLMEGLASGVIYAKTVTIG